MKNPIHPGKYLKMTYVEHMQYNASDLAKRMGISKATVSRLLNGKCQVTANIAVKLEQCFDKSAEFWLSMNNAHYLNKARNKKQD